VQLFELILGNGWLTVVVCVTLGVLIAVRRERRAATRPVDLPDEDEPAADAPDEDVDPELEEARERRDDAFARHDYPEARRWAKTVLRHEEEDWVDLIELGTATALTGDQESGWQMIDDAVKQCERADARMLPPLLVHRAISLLMSWAPTERFVAAVEDARRASPRDENLTVPLLWSYAYQGRFEEAQDLGRLRSWNDDGGMVASMLDMVATFRRAAEQTGTTLESLHRRGFFTPLWDELRAQQLGFGLSDALEALEEPMPTALKSVLRRPAGRKTLAATGGERKVLSWHDGQEPGAGGAWGLDGDFRLMSSAEIAAMDAMIEESPEKFPQWEARYLHQVYTQVMTDDRGGYLVVLAGGRVVIRREGTDDIPVAPRLAEFFWDRVAAWGGRDRRPTTRSRQGRWRGTHFHHVAWYSPSSTLKTDPHEVQTTARRGRAPGASLVSSTMLTQPSFSSRSGSTLRRGYVAHRQAPERTISSRSTASSTGLPSTMTKSAARSEARTARSSAATGASRAGSPELLTTRMADLIRVSSRLRKSCNSSDSAPVDARFPLFFLFLSLFFRPPVPALRIRASISASAAASRSTGFSRYDASTTNATQRAVPDAWCGFTARRRALFPKSQTSASAAPMARSAPAGTARGSRRCAGSCAGVTAAQANRCLRPQRWSAATARRVASSRTRAVSGCEARPNMCIRSNDSPS
jgi:hypothetical protein